MDTYLHALDFPPKGVRRGQKGGKKAIVRFPNSKESNVGPVTRQQPISRAPRREKNTRFVCLPPTTSPSNLLPGASKRARGEEEKWCIAGRDWPTKEDFVARIVFWRVLTNGRHYTGTEPKGALSASRLTVRPRWPCSGKPTCHLNDPTKQLHHRKPLLSATPNVIFPTACPGRGSCKFVSMFFL